MGGTVGLGAAGNTKNKKESFQQKSCGENGSMGF